MAKPTVRENFYLGFNYSQVRKKIKILELTLTFKGRRPGFKKIKEVVKLGIIHIPTDSVDILFSFVTPLRNRLLGQQICQFKGTVMLQICEISSDVIRNLGLMMTFEHILNSYPLIFVKFKFLNGEKIYLYIRFSICV